jgi:hypothetical protein
VRISTFPSEEDFVEGSAIKQPSFFLDSSSPEE